MNTSQGFGTWIPNVLISESAAGQGCDPAARGLLCSTFSSLFSWLLLSILYGSSSLPKQVTQQHLTRDLLKLLKKAFCFAWTGLSQTVTLTASTIGLWPREH